MTDQPDSIQYGFSSIGCANASLEEMAVLGAEFGVDFLEVRALGGTTDLPAYFAAAYPAGRIPAVQPGVRLIATNFHLMGATPQTIDDFFAAVDVAEKVGAPYVRVFGGGKWGDFLTDSAFEQAAQTAQQCRSEMRKKSAACEMLLETHSAFSSSDACQKLNRRLEEPLNILWDSHHTWRNAGESPLESWQQIGSWVRHIHFSDSRSNKPKKGHQCVLPGTGEYPLEALRQVLVEKNYAYGISLEWEKLWHPGLPDVRLALKEFKRLFGVN